MIIRYSGQSGVVAHRAVGVGDVAHGRNGSVRDDDALGCIVFHHHVDDPAAVLLFIAVGLDGDAGLQCAGDVLVAIHRLEHGRVQRLQQGIGEGVRLLGLLGQHGVAAPCGGVLAGGRVGVGQAVAGDVAQRLKSLVQLTLGVGGQRCTQRGAVDRAADLGLCGGDVLCVCHKEMLLSESQ